MPKLSELISDTEALQAQYAGPQESMGEAVKQDVSGVRGFLAGLDPTNPSNLSGLIHHGVPIALQAGLSALTRNTAGVQALSQGAGSLLGYLFQSGAEPLAKGEAPTTTLGGAAGNALLGAGMSTAVKGVGAGMGFLSGKNAAKEATEEATRNQLLRTEALTTKAREQAAGALETATGRVTTAQAAVNREILKHAEGALAGARDAEAEKIIRAGLGPRALIQEPVTIESLTAATAPVQKATQGAMKGVFRGISAKFDQALEQYRDLPITEPSLAQSVKAIRGDAREAGLSIPTSTSKLLKQAEELAGNKVSLGEERLGLMTAGGRTAPISPQYLARLTPEQFASIFKGSDIPGKIGKQQATINQYLGLRTEFTDILLNSKDATARNVASDMVNAIDQDINRVIPKDTQAILGNLRDEWHQARSTFSGAFRNRLFRASSPEQVAEAIYTGAKTGKTMGHRAQLLVNQMEKESPTDLPKVRSAFAGMLSSRPDVLSEVSKFDPKVFKALFRGTGFDDPQAWVEAARGQTNIQAVAKSPELMAKWNSAFQQGMSSLGTKAKEAALAQAEEAIKEVPTAQSLITKVLAGEPGPAEAGRAAGMEAMRKPIGAGYQRYMEHRFVFHTMLGLGAATATHHPMAWAIPLAYLGSSKVIGAALANPRIGRMYYNMLTSPTIEQMGVWAGRMTAAGLSEAARDN